MNELKIKKNLDVNPSKKSPSKGNERELDITESFDGPNSKLNGDCELSSISMSSFASEDENDLSR